MLMEELTILCLIEILLLKGYGCKMLAALLNWNSLSEHFLCRRMEGSTVITRRLVQLEVAFLSLLAFEVIPPVTARAVHLHGRTAGEDARGGRGGGGGEGGEGGGGEGAIHLLRQLYTESAGGILTQYNFVVEHVHASTRRIVGELQC